MKKIMIAVAIVCAAVMAQAATTNWKFSALNIIDSDNKDGSTWNGTVQLMAVGIGEEGADVAVSSGNVVDGKITLSETVFTDTTHFTTGEKYAFYFTATDGDKTFKSNVLTDKLAQDSSKTTTLAFGTQAGNTWVAAPEPTSGLLLLIGMAGLALRRRNA